MLDAVAGENQERSLGVQAEPRQSTRQSTDLVQGLRVADMLP